MRKKQSIKAILVMPLVWVLILSSMPVFASGNTDEQKPETEEAFFVVPEEEEGDFEVQDITEDIEEDEAVSDQEEAEVTVLPAAADGEGTEESQFYIKPISNKVYNASAFEPQPVVRLGSSTGKKLVLGTDYTLAYENNINAGTASVIVNFCGQYTGSQTVFFTIKPAVFDTQSTAADHDFVKDITSKTYIGAAIKPTPVVKAYLNGRYVKLTRGTDFTVAYKNNINAGTATAIVKFRGNFAGSANVKKTFTIKPVSLYSATLPHTEMQYTGSARTMSKATVAKAYVNGKLQTLTYGTDFGVTYKNNVEIGTATAIIKGKGNFTGTIKKTFEITPIPLYSAYFVVYSYAYDTYFKQSSFGYNGEYKTPTVVVTAKVKGKEVQLKKGTDYTVTYSNNRNIGTAKAVIVGKGNYTGKLVKKFTIHRIDYVQWAKYVADDNETYRDYGHTLPSKDKDGAFSCSSLVGAALYLNGYIPNLPPNGHGWLGGLNRDKQCLEGEMLRNGFKYYSCASLGGTGIAQNDTALLKPGDIMWRYHGSSGMHVGIYMGDGLFIESRGGTNDPNAIGVFPDFNYYEGIFRLPGKYLK